MKTDDTIFEKRLGAAISSGWWVVFGTFMIICLYYSLYLWMMSAKPEWVLSVWGAGATWPIVQNISLWALAILKVILWIWIMVVLWMTIWLRKLRLK